MKIIIKRDIKSDSLLPEIAGRVIAQKGDILDVPEERKNWINGQWETKIVFGRFYETIRRGRDYE